MHSRFFLVCCAFLAWLPFQAAWAGAMPLPAPFAFDRNPGRLPKTVVPLGYTIALTPDAQTLTLAGKETVELAFRQASPTIVFNSLNQTLSHVTLDGQPVTGVVSDDKEQTTTVTLLTAAPPGHHTLSFDYIGKIETEPRGLFLQPFTRPGGARDVMLSTQFEATDARRMFPCWDEPAFRATFQLTVTTPARWISYSNMPAVQRTVHGALVTTAFARSPRMAAYLLEFSSGDLAQISGESDGTVLNVVAIKGQEAGGATALANARQIIADYNDFFGMRFPLSKLDSIAVPGGFSGAMENWGAITYNDQFLLITPSSTVGNRQAVFSSQAHEMAHQWFGDLVTMGWWDELWLNESFASWMAARETAIRNPAWHWWEQEDGNKQVAMNADAFPNSHAIIQHVTNELEAASAFDPRITYLKGEAVLRMLEAYLGPDVFRNGIRAYMKDHAYSNTTSADLWAALATASGRDVGAIASGWTSQPGFPLVSVHASCDAAGKRTVTFSQQRFLLDGKDADNDQWNVPLRLRVGNGTTRSVLLPKNDLSIGAGRCDEALSVNADAIGYYRVDYDAATLATNTKAMGRMEVGDRIAMLDDQWALAQAGLRPLDSYLAMAAAMGDTQNQRAWEQITTAFAAIERGERGVPGHAIFVAYARSVIKPLALALGWDAKSDEAPGVRRLRRIVMTDLGAWGDANVIAEARRRFASLVADPSSVPVDDQGMILGIVGQNAGPAEFDQLHAYAKSAKNQTELERAYRALMKVRAPTLARRALGIALSDDIPKQVGTLHLSLVIAVCDEHPALAWEVFSNNVDLLLAPYQPMGPMILAQDIPEIFRDAIPLDQMETWIRHRVPAEAMPGLGRGMATARFKQKKKSH